MKIKGGGSDWWDLREGGTPKKWLWGGLPNTNQRKFGGRAKFWDKKSGQIAGINYFGGGRSSQQESLFERRYVTKTGKLEGAYNLQMTLP